MKNASLFFLLLAATFTSTAQVAFESGLNMANMTLKGGGTKASTQFKPGANLGIVADMALTDNVYFQPGVYYAMEGCKLSGPPKGEYSIGAIQVPLDIVYKTGEKCGPRLFAGAGVTIVYNMSGSYVQDAFGPFPSNSGELKIGSNKTDNLKQTGMAMNMTFGYILKKHLYIRARYTMGISNLNPAGDDKNSAKESSISLNLGYLFGGCGGQGSVNGFRIRGGNHWRGMSKGRFSRRQKPPRYE